MSNNPCIEFPPFDGGFRVPRDRRAAYRRFGDPKRGPTEIRRKHIIACDLQGFYPDAESSQSEIYCHRLAAPFLQEALRRCRTAGVLVEIDSINCYEHRRVRHTTRGPWSYHALGVAVDINPHANRIIDDIGSIIPFSHRWRLLWPHGLSEAFVACWESVGWRWGGRFPHYRNPMHFQLAGHR